MREKSQKIIQYSNEKANLENRLNGEKFMKYITIDCELLALCRHNMRGRMFFSTEGRLCQLYVLVGIQTE